jgi:hypothetical protein
MNWGLPHMLVAASVRPNLFFLFAHLSGSSQHHNTEFDVALKCDRNPWHRCLYNGMFALKFWVDYYAVHPQSESDKIVGGGVVMVLDTAVHD